MMIKIYPIYYISFKDKEYIFNEDENKPFLSINKKVFNRVAKKLQITRIMRSGEIIKIKTLLQLLDLYPSNDEHELNERKKLKELCYQSLTMDSEYIIFM